MSILRPFGLVIREYRKKSGFTLEALGRKLNVAKGYLSSIENAKVNPPSRKVLIKLAKALGVSVIELMLRSVPVKAPIEIKGQLEGLIAEALSKAGIANI